MSSVISAQAMMHYFQTTYSWMNALNNQNGFTPVSQETMVPAIKANIARYAALHGEESLFAGFGDALQQQVATNAFNNLDRDGNRQLDFDELTAAVMSVDNARHWNDLAPKQTSGEQSWLNNRGETLPGDGVITTRESERFWYDMGAYRPGLESRKALMETEFLQTIHQSLGFWF